MVLKALPKPYVTIKDFFREFHYGLQLAAHKNIITTYDVAFETAGFYVFSQEYAPLGDLTSNISETGIGEIHSKKVAKQLAAGLDYIHAHDLVHRDVKLDNILVFKSDFSRIKLCDFGETRRARTPVMRRNEWIPYSPPEVLATPVDVEYKCETCHDVWQFGIVIFVCLTGCLPWQKAAMDDPRYARYLYWHGSAGVLQPVRKPKLFKMLSSKAQRWFRKLLEPKAEKRPPAVCELSRYLEERWLAKSSSDRTEDEREDELLCPSMYSFHSSLEEKNVLLSTLMEYGLETTVDRKSKKDRIRQWIQNSSIAEEEEEEPMAASNMEREPSRRRRDKKYDIASDTSGTTASGSQGQ
ncbi:serine/threonine-protein kinase SBK1 isoform X2 [Cimex lectularius]|nr:serine/threonine-protein kinase SBK1 isoform X2 [Cimex lectularius]